MPTLKNGGKINDLRGEINFMMEKLDISPQLPEAKVDFGLKNNAGKAGKKEKLLNQTIDEV